MSHFYTLWAINAPLDLTRLCRQLDEMRAFGFDGVVFHPRFYPGQPAYLGDEYMRIVSRTILHAKSIGMDFWIYDEDGWPSGTVGGEMLRLHPEVRQQWADLTIENAPTDEVLASFEHANQTWNLVRRNGKGVDYLNSDLARHFLAMTHERYRDALEPEAFAHVSAFFSDEPEFGLGHAFDSLSPSGSIPWTTNFGELYQQRYGQSLADALPALFFPLDGHETIRVRFWELLTDLFCESFIVPINKWCLLHGKRLTAHLKGEEHPLFQVPTNGSAQQVFGHLSLPGIDALERDPSNDFFPRQLASAARQFGDGRSMVECFGGAGWGAEPEDFRRYLLWLGGHGITDFVVHLWQYRLDSHAIRDWPASIPNHVGWADAFGQLLTQVKPEMAAAADQAGVDRAETLLVSPHRGVMARFEPRELLSMNIHDAGTYADTPAGRINDRFMATVADLQARNIAWHCADERTFELGKPNGSMLEIGNSRYRHVVVSDDCVLTAAGTSLLTALEKAGITSFDRIGAAAAAAAADIAVSKSAAVQEPLAWSIQVPSNQLPLEPAFRADSGQFEAVFDCQAEPMDLWILFADSISEVRLNNSLLKLESLDEGTVAAIPAELVLRGRNRVQFSTCGLRRDVQSTPFVWISGHFAIAANGPHLAGPNGTIALNGPLVIIALPTQIGRDLTAAGYGFVRESVQATAVVHIPETTSFLQFVDIAGDCARVEIDGRDLGFIWGPDWRVALTVHSGSADHRLTITLYPSAFNWFGPHHHVNGDCRIVSPVQFQGRRNFADTPGTPDFTRSECWHVKPLRFASASIAIGRTSMAIG